MAEVGDEHAGGEVVEPAAFGRPVVDAGAAGEHGLGRRVGPQGTRLEPGGTRSRAALEVGLAWRGAEVHWTVMVQRPSPESLTGRGMRVSDCVRDRGPRASAWPGTCKTSPPSGAFTSTTQPGWPRRVALQDRFHRLHDGHRVAVGRQVVVSQGPHLLQPLGALGRRGRRTRRRRPPRRSGAGSRCRSRAATRSPHGSRKVPL